MPNISRNSTIGQEILKHNQPAVHKLFSEDLKYPKFKEIIEKYWKNEISLKIHQVKRLHGELFILNKVNQQNPFLYVPEDEIIDLLDEEQREYAFNLKEGHRILLGCAGSGKTIVLIRRVQYLAEIHKNWKILVLCYNSLLNNMLKTFINSNSLSPAKITIRTFHSWAKWVIESIPEFKIKYGEEWERSKYSKKEKDIFFEEKVPVMLNEVLQIKEDSGNPLLYDAILIDEGQDFHSDWYKLVLRTLKNPEEGSLFIAYDGLQGIYRKEGVSWKSLGIKASGRTKKLPNSYRNSKRVGEFAQFIMPRKFKELSKSQDEFKFPEKYIGMHGSINYLITKSKIEEYNEILKIIKEELKNSTKGKSFLVLFQTDPWNDRNNKFFSQAMKYDLFENFLDTWTSSGYGIVVTSLRKAKGLEADIVFIPDLEQYCYQDRQLLYVGMTRTKNKLILSSTESNQPNSLVDEIKDYPDLHEE